MSKYKIYTYYGSYASQKVIGETDNYDNAVAIARKEFDTTNCRMVEVGRVNDNSIIVDCVFSLSKPYLQRP